MNSFTKPTKRAAIATCVAGVALLGAIGVGGAAYADGMPTPSASGSASSAPAAPTPNASGAPAAPGASGGGTAPAAPGASGAPAGPAAGGPAGGPAAVRGAHQPHIGGEVQSVSGSTITVKDMDGFTRTITLTDGATVTKDGASSSASAITKGEHIEATGTVDSNGTTLDASSVAIGQPAGPGRGGPAGGPAAGGKGPQGGPAAGGTGQVPTPPSGGPGAQQGGSTDQGSTGQSGSSAPAAPSAPSPQQSGGTTTAPAAPTQSAPVQGS